MNWEYKYNMALFLLTAEINCTLRWSVWFNIYYYLSSNVFVLIFLTILVLPALPSFTMGVSTFKPYVFHSQSVTSKLRTSYLSLSTSWKWHIRRIMSVWSLVGDVYGCSMKGWAWLFVSSFYGNNDPCFQKITLTTVFDFLGNFDDQLCEACI